MSTPKISMAARPLDGSEMFFVLQGGRFRRTNVKALSDVVAKGEPGKDGVVPVYNTSGNLWRGVIEREFDVRVGANGVWGVEYSALGFTDTPIVHAMAWSSSTTASGQVIATGETKSLTRATGRAVSGISGSLTGLSGTLKFAPADTVVTVTVRGPTE